MLISGIKTGAEFASGKALAFAVFILLAVVSSCSQAAVGTETSGAGGAVAPNPFASYRNIPGVTAEEIAAIEALQEQTGVFIFGTTPNSESYTGDDGEVHGFTSLLCEWMSDMFGIRFRPVIYTWGDLVHGL
ncbi:MAG: hypothetical protein LBH97_02210, partial [Treponema sp.]|nr:hypothetical protein [Treponema sp.]